MASVPEVDGVVAEAAGAEVVERTRPQSAFAWDWWSIGRCVRALAVATVAAFLVAVAVGALAPGLPGRVLAFIDKVAFWPTAYLSHVLAFFLFILINNIRAALTAAALGPLSVWVNGRINARHQVVDDAELSLIDRAAGAMARGLVAVGQRIFPELGDLNHDFAVRTSAALAAVVPFLALGVNGAVLGIWLAEGLLTGWVEGLAKASAILLPHGPLEFPALILSAAVGLALARELLPTASHHDSTWQADRAKKLLFSDRMAQSLALIVGLLAVAAALEVTHLV